MTFGEKLRYYRKKKKLTQAQLAKLTNLGINTVANYEAGRTYPQNREVYSTLAEVLDVDVNALKNEGDGIEDIDSAQGGKNEPKVTSFVMFAGGDGPSAERLQAAKLVSQVNALFAGGSLSETDKDAVMLALQEAYVTCKRENKEKYGIKKNPE